MLGERGVDGRALDPAQAHLGPALQGHRPGEAPAVAMEHRQRPEVDRVEAHVPDQDVADRVQIGAAVVGHHPLRPAGGARGVAEGYRLPLVGRQERLEARITLGQKLLVGELAQALARDLELGLDHVDDQRPPPCLCERRLDHRGVFGVGQQDLGLGVVQDVGDGLGLEADVQRVDHRARHRDAVVRIQHGGHVRQHHRDRVAGPDAPADERRGEPPAAPPQLGIVGAPGAMNDRGPPRIHIRRALEEADRGQGRVVGRVLAQVLLIGAGLRMLGEAHGPHSIPLPDAADPKVRRRRVSNSITPVPCRQPRSGAVPQARRSPPGRMSGAMAHGRPLGPGRAAARDALAKLAQARHIDRATMRRDDR